MLRIRFILIWIRIRILGSVSWNNVSGSGSCSKSDLKSGKYQLFFYFFFDKKYISPKYGLFCYLYGKYLCSKHKFNSFEKDVWYSKYFGGFWWKFSMILVDLLLPGSGSGWPKWNGSKRIRICNTDFDWFFATGIRIRIIDTDPDPEG